MRNQFAKLMTHHAADNENLVLLYADIGNRLFNPLKEIAPERTINAGIAEANMASMAAGLAAEGFKPFCYTITPFTSSRNYEQIKIDIAYQQLPVVIVGTGSGLSYANLGPTHHSFEDLAIMRVLPNMKVVCPADSLELAALFPQLLAEKSPVYCRIGKKNEPLCYEEQPQLTLGKAHVVFERPAHLTSIDQQAGKRVAILSNGTILPLARAVGMQLVLQGHDVRLSSFHTIKPLDTQHLADTFAEYDVVVTLEEHSIHGGFGSSVAEWLVDQSAVNSARLVRFGIPDTFIDRVHSRDDALEQAGLTKEKILAQLQEALNG